MPAIRTIGVPLDHLIAELRAFPFASEWALHHPFVAFDAGLQKQHRQLWYAAERELLGSIPGFSIDELHTLRDALWFSAPRATGDRAPRASPRTPLHVYLRELAEDCIVVSGGVARPKRPGLRNGDDPRIAPQVMARQAWRWMTFALPPDLLVAALSPPVGRVELVSPAVDRTLLDEGFAETHMHLGAGLDFAMIWPGTLSLLAQRECEAKTFESPGAGFKAGLELGPWLLRAALARYVLGLFLVRRGAKRFASFLSQLNVEIARMFGASACGLLKHALVDLHTGNLRCRDFAELRELYAELSGVRRLPRPTGLRDWRRLDPLSRVFPHEENVEVGYVRAALAYLHGAGREESALFAALFWQTVRVRTGLYRYVVQRPLTPGLQWFVRFYGRMATSRGNMPDAVRLEAAATISGVGRGLRSLEVRTAPASRGPALLRQVRVLAAAATKLQAVHSTTEIGIVYHLIKDRGENGAHWAGNHADPTLMRRADDSTPLNTSGMRYGAFFSARRRDAEALVWTLHHFPDSVHFIRGIDVCTDELGVPNWVLGPLVSYVRSNALAAQRSARSVANDTHFGTTVHAGEDFVHLLTGLRNLDDAVEIYGLSEGDRIGHGLALGIEPTEWARRAGRLAVLTEDRLFDLVWVWQWLSRGSLGFAPGSHFEREIRDLAGPMFGEDLGPQDVLELMRNLARRPALCAVGFPERARTPRDLSTCKSRGSRQYSILYRYLTDCGVFERSRRTVWIDPLLDQELLERLQPALRAKVVARGITIEVNPTSNLLIGDYGDLSRHPLWRLRPPRRTNDAPDLSICIGSDDPSVFASNLREEYQWIEDAMRMAGASDEEARCWLLRTRACGLETRFTLPRPRTPVHIEFAPRGDMQNAPF